MVIAVSTFAVQWWSARARCWLFPKERFDTVVLCGHVMKDTWCGTHTDHSCKSCSLSIHCLPIYPHRQVHRHEWKKDPYRFMVLYNSGLLLRVWNRKLDLLDGCYSDLHVHCNCPSEAINCQSTDSSVLSGVLGSASGYLRVSCCGQPTRQVMHRIWMMLSKYLLLAILCYDYTYTINWWPQAIVMVATHQVIVCVFPAKDYSF